VKESVTQGEILKTTCIEKIKGNYIYILASESI